ncbi:Protein alcS [Penicillium rubens]|nr:Protein alcS [Penicillium rubens]
MVAAVTDWIVGNTVSSVVFATFGCFWVTYAATMVPWFGVLANYETTSAPGVKITDTATYDASFATWMIFMAVMCTIFMFCSMRANLALVVMQFFFVITFVLLPMSFWYQAEGDQILGRNLQIAAGAMSFVGSVIGWYIFISVMFEAADFPLALPVGDLSRRWPRRKYSDA